jgi:hypothetical protein
MEDEEVDPFVSFRRERLDPGGQLFSNQAINDPPAERLSAQLASGASKLSALRTLARGLYESFRLQQGQHATLLENVVQRLGPAAPDE